jgi:peptidoglycan/LPS O-acetylase OafA/YrhL
VENKSTALPESSQPHFVALDSLRGIAALSVVFFHISWMNPTESLGYVRNSYLMVDVFFVLSGFVIFYAYHNKLGTLAEERRFLWLRFWRLYPLHFAFLLVFLLIECLKAWVQWRYGLVANHPAFKTNNLYSFVTNLLLIQSLHTNNDLTYNGPAWSISVEFYTYILFAVILFCLRGTRAVLAAAVLISAMSFALLVWLGPGAEGSTYSFGIVRCLTGFFLGVLTFILYDAVRKTRAVADHSDLIGRAAVIAMIGFAIFIACKSEGFSDLAVYPFSAAVILFVSLSPANGATHFLCAKPFVWLGTVSYSIYMAHSSVLWFVAQAVRFGAHAKEIALPLHDTPVLTPSPIVGSLAAAAGVALVLGVASLSYKWIEKPFRDWSREAWKSSAQRTQRVWSIPYLEGLKKSRS